MGQGGPMSAVNSNSDDRDLDAIRRAQRAHEPSMEEILASIRAIIADDREPSAPSAGLAASKPGPQIVYSSDAPRAVSPPPEPASPTVVKIRDAEPRAEPSIDEEPLISEEAEEEIAQ